MSKKNSFDKLSHDNEPRVIERRERAAARRSRLEKKGGGTANIGFGSIFAIILVLLIIVSLAQFLRTGTAGNMGFSGFINFLSNAPSFDINWSIIDLTIYSDWGIFEFLRIFINWFTAIFEVLVFIFGMLVETIEYLFYFIRGLLFP